MRLVEVTSETRELTLTEACMVQYINSFSAHGLCNVSIYERALKYLDNVGLIIESVMWEVVTVTGEFVYEDARDMTAKEQYMWDYLVSQESLRDYFNCEHCRIDQRDAACKIEFDRCMSYPGLVSKYEKYFEKYGIEDD